MESVRAKEFIKLGTALRYLIDAREGHKLAGKHVLENIKAVLDLIPKLRFHGTVDSGGYKQLTGALIELRTASESSVALTDEQASSLERICRTLRESLLAEGNNRVLYFLSPAEVEAATSPGWPSTVTLDLLRRTPWGVAKWFLGLLVGAFLLGVTAGEMDLFAKASQAMEALGSWSGG